MTRIRVGLVIKLKNVDKEKEELADNREVLLVLPLQDFDRGFRCYFEPFLVTLQSVLEHFWPTLVGSRAEVYRLVASIGLDPIWVMIADMHSYYE